MKRIAFAISLLFIPCVAFGQVDWGVHPDGGSLYFLTNTVGTDGVAETIAAETIAVYLDNSDTQLTTGASIDDDVDATTGLHRVTIDTTQSGFVAGSRYTVTYTAGTCDSVSLTGRVIGTFRLGVVEGQYVARHVSKSGVTTYYYQSADTDAARGTALLAAQTAASTGTIFVDHPITCSVTAGLGKNAVNWHFCQGSIVTTATASLTLWSDYAAGSPSAMVFAVTGKAKFTATGADAIAVGFYHASSRVTMECEQIHNQSTGQATAISIGGGSHSIKANLVRSDEYDGFIADGGWLDLEVVDLEGGDNAVEWLNSYAATSGQPSGFRIVAKGRLYGQFGSAAAGTPSATIVSTSGAGTIGIIEASRIVTHSVSGVAVLMDNSGGTFRTFVRCPSIEGNCRYGDGTHRIAGTIDSTAYNVASLTLNASDTLTLDNCRLVTKSSETNSIAGITSTRTVLVAGHITYNKALSSATLTHQDGVNWARVSNPTTTTALSGTTVGTLTTYTGNTPQTGDAFVRIGAAGAGLTSIDLPNQTMDITGSVTGNLSGSVGSLVGHTVQTGDGYAILNSGAFGLAVIEAQTDDIGVAGAGLTAISGVADWTATQKAQILAALSVDADIGVPKALTWVIARIDGSMRARAAIVKDPTETVEVAADFRGVLGDGDAIASITSIALIDDSGTETVTSPAFADVNQATLFMASVVKFDLAAGTEGDTDRIRVKVLTVGGNTISAPCTVRVDSE